MSASIDHLRGLEGDELTATLAADGYLLLPAAAEPHAHLDKALTADRVPNPRGDLLGAIEAWLAHRPTITVDDYADRAEQAARMSLVNGITTIRTHVDLGAELGTTAVEGVLAAKERLGDLVDLQLVGLTGRPTTGPDGAANLAVLRRALDLGLDVVGGCPHLDPDPDRCTDVLLDIAGEYGRPIDLHTDETLDPTHLHLEHFAERVSALGFDHGAVASHCVSLGVQSEATQRRVAEKVAAARVAVVALPQTNLFLQARGERVAPARGLTALTTLDEAGAVVCAGADNLQDPFCTMGRADPFETAALMVMAGHDTPEQAYARVSSLTRQAIGMLPGSHAAHEATSDDVLAVRAGSLREAIASAPVDRVVIRSGRVVAAGGHIVS